MKPIATYVFIDLQSSGLPVNSRIVEITELAMVAVKRTHFLNTDPDELPRVQYKLHKCFSTERSMCKKSVSMTGLKPNLLKDEPVFDERACEVINSFINCLEKPVCLIGHNALKFHLQLLKYHLKTLKFELSDEDNILCSDSLYAFFDVLQADDIRKYTNDSLKKPLTKPMLFWKLYREQFYRTIGMKRSYQLGALYNEIVGEPYLESNWAENNCIKIMSIALTIKEDFEKWIANNHCLFSGVCPMVM
ncbi:three-prime repair exonuclease 1-like [Spodoptera litura]|uniref:Three-prime repair exonuclease 1-like n=1 Tax=Spodoptera litura TaxID=69820 RepID=A0A9J7EM06_SPOLT|nr:three-prime repair exonuclease 1-like [Spodoptera litura]